MGLLKKLFGLIVFVAFLAILGRIFLFELARTDSFSMIPTLVPGDYFLVYTRGEIKPGEIAVCTNPTDAKTMIVARVMGVPGSTFEIRNNTVIASGKRKDLEQLDDLVYEDRTSGERFEYTVRVARERFGGHRYRVGHMKRAGRKNFDAHEVRDGFFLVGDNRNRARDSRTFGEVPIESCIGKALLVIWPGEDNGDLKRSDRFFEWLI